MIDALIDDLTDTVLSLTGVIEEESEQLATLGRCPGLPVLAEAKQKLVNRLERSVAMLDRQDAGWHARIEAERKTELSDAFRRLAEVAAINADILRRQIDLSNEMMAAVAQEMQRASGRRSESYCQAGMLALREENAPISINTRM